MMRLLMGLFWTLALFVLWSQDGRGDPAGAPTGENESWPKIVEGLGMDLQKAKENALKEAQKEIVACLRRHQPPLASWVPPEAFIEKNLVRKQKKGDDLLFDKMTFKRWLLFLTIPDWDMLKALDREAQDSERAQRGRERMVILARGFAGLLVLLAAVAAGIRLDDWTRGSYRRWLQLAGASLVAAAWAGLWLLI